MPNLIQCPPIRVSTEKRARCFGTRCIAAEILHSHLSTTLSPPQNMAWMTHPNTTQVCPFPLFYLFTTLTTTHAGRRVSKSSHMRTPQRMRHADVAKVHRHYPFFVFLL